MAGGASLASASECCLTRAQAWLVDFAGPAGVVEEKVLICDGTGEDPSCHNSACMLGLCTR